MRRSAQQHLGAVAAALTLLAAPALASAQDEAAQDAPAQAGETKVVESPSQAGGRESAPLESVPRISLQEALDVATGKHPNLEQARAAMKVAEANRKKARAGFGPTLSAEASAQLWNEELAFDIGMGGGDAPQLPPPSTPYEQIIAGMFAAPAEPTVIRSQFTWSASITLAQPLTPLWMVYHGHKAMVIGEEVAEKQLTQAERDLANQAAVSYFRLLQVQASLDTANQSVERLNAQVSQLEALVAAGAAKKADKLRIEVAVAAAKQEVANLKAAMRISRSALAVALGADPSEPIDASPLGQVDLPDVSGSPDAAVEAALDARPELQQLKLQMQQADQAIKVKQGNYIPQVVAMAQYSHSEGQGLAGSDSAFVGLAASWDIWKWGADYYDVDAARAQRLQLDSAYTQARRQIGLQVRSAWYDVQSAAEGYSVATKAVAQAEEAYRIETVRYEAGESTPTDLLAAQSALTEAQNNQNNALYQTLIKNTEFIYATGRPLTVESLLEGVNQ
ncbi:TolC family protein [Bradymonas sediminis]|nr:TolC family protein [Bradymonas sediminis]TDP75762.1 outer membrane protein TolC [Bradymonas sediminis]